MSTGRVVVVGLGPAGADLLVPAARAAIERIPNRFVRTARHPTVEDLAHEGLTFRSFDHAYDAARSIDDVYPAIADALAEAAERDGEVLLAVPGNPAVAERTLALLRARDDIAVEVVPGLSFAELAWARLGIDPMATGARVVDARDASFAGAHGPVLVAQVDSRFVLSDVKLGLLEHLDADARVVVLQRLGLADESVREVTLAELDREVEPDHLTAVLAHVEARSVGAAMERFVALAERLRAPGGCPWDGEQTHHSLARYVLEEAYEVLEAVDALPADAPAAAGAGSDPAAYAALEEELGDLLYQVVFHATLAREAGVFTMVEVVDGIHDKLVRRHPHVFGGVDAATSSEVRANWEDLKRAEKGRGSVMAGVDPSLPSLLYAHKLLGKASSVGIETGPARDEATRASAAADALVHADGAEAERALERLLAAAVALGRSKGLDGESVLRGWAARFRSRFETMEREATGRGVDVTSADRDVVVALWDEAGGGS